MSSVAEAYVVLQIQSRPLHEVSSGSHLRGPAHPIQSPTRLRGWLFKLTSEPPTPGGMVLTQKFARQVAGTSDLPFTTNHSTKTLYSTALRYACLRPRLPT